MRKLIRISLYMLGLFVLFVLVLIMATAAQVDDWSRDLDQNRASTSTTGENAIAPMTVSESSTSKVESLIKEAISDLPKWKFIDSNIEESGSTESPEINLTRTTSLFQFVDDVQIKLEISDGNTILNVTSQSRVGKGDLGQNPRNIKELFSAIKEHVEK